MLYASSKDAIKRKLDGIFTEVQCTDSAEISHEAVLDKVFNRLLTFTRYFIPVMIGSAIDKVI